MKKFKRALLVLIVLGLGWLLYQSNQADLKVQEAQTENVQTFEESSLSPSPAATTVNRNLLIASQDFLQLLRKPNQLNVQNCSTFLGSSISTLQAIDTNYFDYDALKTNFREIIQNLFQIRIELRNQLKEMVEAGQIQQAAVNDPCVNALRDSFRTARFIEDYLGEVFLGYRAFDAKVDPVAVDTLQGSAPRLLLNPEFKKMTLRSGDLILSRGNAYASAAIARIGNVHSQFSHVAMVFVENEAVGKEFSIGEARKNPNVKVLEAHIGVGATIRTFAAYANDGNARNAVFRFANAELAHQAATTTYKYLDEYRHGQQQINGGPVDYPDNAVPYDFHMTLGDFSEMYCSEIPYLGYRAQGVPIPMFMTHIDLQKNDFAQRLDITKLDNFAPGDIEVDVRFSYVGEWRDYRYLKNIRQKDEVLSVMYDWMRKYNYRLYPSGTDSGKALIGFISRQLDLKYVRETMPLNMNISAVETIMTLNSVGQILQNRLQTEEANYQASHFGLPLPMPEAKRLLEHFRLRDEALFRDGKSSEFHERFHSAP